jgi:hypothetical protein
LRDNLRSIGTPVAEVIVGSDEGTPVVEDYTGSGNRFTGKIERVTIDLK